MRTSIAAPPFAQRARPDAAVWEGPGNWPANWVVCPAPGEPPFVTAFRCRFTVEADVTVRCHVSADERYELLLDGWRIGRGPERGDANHWFFETYDIPLSMGDHVLVARVWSLGDLAPYAQMTVRPGFLFAPEGDLLDRLGTGVAPWEAKRLGGYGYQTYPWAMLVGARITVDGAAFDWGFETGEGDGWAGTLEIGRLLDIEPGRERRVGVVRHVSEPPSADTLSVPIRAVEHLAHEAEVWNLTAGGGPATVPPNARRRVIIDLEDYYCAYPEVTVSGGKGGTVRLSWAESLYDGPEFCAKGHRDEIEGKFFRGLADAFRPDGGTGRRFDTLWWQAGRYLELYVETADEPLVVDGLTLRETRLPLEMGSEFAASDPRLGGVIPIAVRALQMCSHETYMDCPYYEQLMYAGDTRLEVLTTYCLTRDDRLPRKALAMFDASRIGSGLTQSRYPNRVRQIIPPFSLWWVAMLHDYARWRDDEAFVRQRMPGARGVIDAFLSYRNRDGLIEGPPGWNFMDWVPAWRHGIPPDGHRGASGIINWQMVLVLGLMAELETSMDEPELAARADRLADDLAACASAAFWDEDRGLFADDRAKAHFSEHAQCLAVLSGRVAPERANRAVDGLLHDADLARTTIYFTHYLIETFGQAGCVDAMLDRLGLWFELPSLGFKTTRECPEPSRSDCHAWGAHPVYHYFASILGIRPADFGFRHVRIAPQLGPLASARGRLVHPKGMIEVDLGNGGDGLHGRIVLPKGVTGTFQHAGTTVDLHDGAQELQATETGHP